MALDRRSGNRHALTGRIDRAPYFLRQERLGKWAMTVVLILGSAPDVVQARQYDRTAFGTIVAINNAWAVRPDWDVHIHPEDFAPSARPVPGPDQRVATFRAYVPAMNAYGGVVWCGGTMAFTATYWALHVLRPRVIAYLGCDMIYPKTGTTHFYGAGSADPLRPDITLRSLTAKSARAEALAARQGCALVNLSEGDSRLTFPRARPDGLHRLRPRPHDAARIAALRAEEDALDYAVPDGRYWEAENGFDTDRIDAIDAAWIALSP